MTTRWIALLFVGLGIAIPSHAVPITRIYGEKPDKAFLQQYFDRWFKMYSARAPATDLMFTPTEKKLFPLWRTSLDQWGYAFSQGQIFEHFLATYTVKDGKALKPSLFLGSRSWPEDSKSLIRNISQQRGYKVPEPLIAYFHGFQWNSEDHSFEVHFLFVQEDVSSLPLAARTLSQKYTSPHWQIPRKYVIVMSAQKTIVQEKMIFAASHVDWNLVGTPLPLDALSLQKTVGLNGAHEWRMDLRSLAPTFIDTTFRTTTSEWAQEFFLYPDSLSYFNVNNYKLYYP